ncbi:putative F-box protein At1g67623 [Phalaenopsis equestris]|uniref:putative F-box protein At1g67623 n=1 Tax=Phalaenopsis equestris TaxID=78828 RepID=UPI0009E560D6|nr:putative F-box protein At1g67623 [Phalaenopsis equestris]
MKNKNFKKATSETPIYSLPPDLLEEILLKTISTSSSPIKDIRDFRKICKNFHVACSSKRVGKYMIVEDWKKSWQDKQGYLSFIRSCADCKNSDALFWLGLEELLIRERVDVGLHYLQIASSGGHVLSKYIAGLVLLREESTRWYGVYLLNEISNKIHQCREETSNIFMKMKWDKLSALSVNHCDNLSCGKRSLEGDNRWLSENHVKRIFCSDICEWVHEYNMFVNRRYLSIS